jgi:very-short-patch-repair endonuclease
LGEDAASLCHMKLRRQTISPGKLRRARELRRQLTIAEREAWRILRNRGVLGLKFRRQHIIDGFIVDFYCAELRLVLEVDGPAHSDAARAEYDAARTAHLQLRGLRVIRLRNEDISEAVLTTLLQELAGRSPSPRSGEGDRG